MRWIGTKVLQGAAITVFVGTLSLLPCSANAAEHRFSALLDTDNNPATGCTVASVNGPVQGVEQVATTIVTTSTLSVTVARLEMQVCNAGVLGAASVYDGGGWNVGLGNGMSGMAVIEASIPLGSLPPTGTMKAFVTSSNATSGQDATAPFSVTIADAPATPLRPIPLSPWLALPLALMIFGATAWWHRRHPGQTGLVVLALFVVGSGLVWAATVIRDGNVGDWGGIAAAVTDPAGDAPVDADVVAVFYQQDGTNLYLRIDADVRKDAAGNSAPVVNAGATQTITLPAAANLAGTATDDGLPNPPGALTTTWSRLSGPAGVVFGNAGQTSTTVQFLAAGTYVLRLKADDGALIATSDVQITVNDAAPTLKSVADRTIPVGTHLQIALSAEDGNASDTLIFSLPGAPAGATLNPSPIVDWTPTSAQLGTHTFTGRVADSAGHSDSKSFHVTVVSANRPPVLAPQADATLPIGAMFTRTLSATDPDVGDTLNFALVSGPAGMTLAGSSLSWPTAGTPPATYPVVVKVTDAGGLFDLKRFFLTLRAAAPPVAHPDSYEVRLGDTLATPAPGVLGNDFDPSGGGLTAAKLTNPDKGTLNAFNADGSFNFTAPPTQPGPVFAPIVKYSLDAAPYGWAHQPVVIDVDGDGLPEIITSSLNPGGYGLRAYHVAGGALTVLWDLPDVSALTQAGDCTNFYSGGEPMRLAAGDIDDSGQISIVFAVACQRDIPTVPSFTAARYIAVNARDGTFKWLSPSLGGTRPEPLWGGTSEDGVALNTVPSIARMHVGESPSIVFAGEYSNDPWGVDKRCEHMAPGFVGSFCRAAFVLNGVDGTVRQKMVALASDYIEPTSQGTTNTQPAAVVADLDGTGNMNIIFGATVWNADGSIKWNITDSRITDPNSHIYTFWNGLGNFDDTPDIEIVRVDRTAHDSPSGPARLAVFKSDGTMLWSLFLSGDTWNGIPTIADIDGSGRPSVVLFDSQRLCAIDYRGLYKWCHDEGQSPLFATPNLRTATRAAVYDLDGDGIPEVIMPLFGERLLFLDGATGNVKFDYDMAAGRPPLQAYPQLRDASIVGSPIVADFENNGHASILSVWSGLARMDIVASQTNDWRPARKIFNQTSYFVGNINDDGSIPATFVNNFATPSTNVFGTQGQVLLPFDPRVRTRTSFDYNAAAGGLVSGPGTVTIDILPANRPPAFTSTPPTRWAGSFPAFDYPAHAVDPDVGDTVSYSIVLAGGSDFSNGAGACTIGAGTGLLHCPTLYSGSYTFVIAATDTFGASALQTVSLTRSSGPAIVPNVVGQSSAAASSTLLAAGFVTGNVDAIYSAAPVGQVIAQVPAAGANALLGEAIALQTSKGPAPVAVPFVVGQSLTAANSTLTSIGFTVSVTRVFSTTVPANEVMAQAPAAGTLVTPLPASPVALTVSSGNGLVLTLNRSVATADQTIVVTPAAFDANGVATALPALTYAVMPTLTPYPGPLPAIAGTTITPGLTTMGAFRVTATDAANGRTATADFAIVSPRVVGEATHGEAFADMMQALDAIFALKQPLIAARDANDVPQMTALLQQMVAIWRTVDLDDLKISMPLVAPDQFVLTLPEMTALGGAPTPDDILVRQVLRDGIADITNWSLALRANGGSMAQLESLADQFSTRAARMDGLTISRYGGIYNQADYTRLLAHRIPEFYEALFEELAAVSGLPRRGADFPAFKRAHAGPVAKSTLAELGVTLATNYVIEKIMDAANETYKNAKQFGLDSMKQAAWCGAAVGIAAELKAYVLGGNVYAVISGASQSFRVFNEPAPGNDAIIEVPGYFDDPELTSVQIIGPDTIAAAGNAVTDLFQKLKDGFSYGLDAKNNPAKFKNFNQAKKVAKDLLAKLKAVGKAVTTLQDVIDASYQTAGDVLPGCIFTSDPECAQLYYPTGINPVYRYTPPPGSGGIGGIPVPIIFIVQNLYTGLMYFDTPSFLPAPKKP